MKGDVCEKVEVLGMNECFWRYMQWCRILSVVAPNWFAWFHSRLQVINEAFEELNSWFSHVFSCCIMKTQGRMTDMFDIPGLLFKSLIKCETHLFLRGVRYRGVGWPAIIVPSISTPKCGSLIPGVDISRFPEAFTTFIRGLTVENSGRSSNYTNTLPVFVFPLGRIIFVCFWNLEKPRHFQRRTGFIVLEVHQMNAIYHVYLVGTTVPPRWIICWRPNNTWMIKGWSSIWKNFKKL